jgi:hypothetical protein
MVAAYQKGEVLVEEKAFAAGPFAPRQTDRSPRHDRLLNQSTEAAGGAVTVG